MMDILRKHSYEIHEGKFIIVKPADMCMLIEFTVRVQADVQPVGAAQGRL